MQQVVNSSTGNRRLTLLLAAATWFAEEGYQHARGGVYQDVYMTHTAIVTCAIVELDFCYCR